MDETFSGDVLIDTSLYLAGDPGDHLAQPLGVIIQNISDPLRVKAAGQGSEGRGKGLA